MLVHQVMTSPAVTVREDDTVRHAAEVLLENRIASAPVLDGVGRLVGIVSEADLLRGRTARDPRAHLRPAGAEAAPPPTTVAQVMSARPLYVHARSDADDAARLLLDHGIKAAPVVEGGRVVGVVARRDLLRSFARPDADIHRDVLDLLAAFGEESRWGVHVEAGVVRLTGGPVAGGGEGPGGGAEDRRRVAAVLARTVPGVVRVLVEERRSPPG